MENIIIFISIFILIVLLSSSLSWFYIKYTLGLLYTTLSYFYRSLCFIVLLCVAISILDGFYHHITLLLKEQVAYSNLGHIEIYKTDNKENIANKKEYIEITNAEEIIHLLTNDKQLLEKIHVISPQIIFSGMIENVINKKTILFSGLGIEPKSLLTIGAYDLTVSGSELSDVRKTEITIDKFIADAININYGDLVNVIFIHNNEKMVLPTYVRGIFNTQINTYPYAMIKTSLETLQYIKKSKTVSKINILLKNVHDMDSVIAKITMINKEKSLNLQVIPVIERQSYIISIVTFFKWSMLLLYTIVVIYYYFLVNKIIIITIKKSISDLFEFNRLGIWQGGFSRLFILLAIFITITLSITILLIHQLLSWLINLKQINITISDNNSYSLMIPWLWQYDAMFKIALLLLFSAVIASCNSIFKVSHYLKKHQKNNITI
ncbi:TPA: hypothetical protein ACKRF0_002456 [Proteus mirabilis]